MSSEIALNLSIPELLRALNEKLGLECTRAREICIPLILNSISVKAEVSGSQSIRLNKVTVGSNGELGPLRFTVSKPEHGMF